HLWWDDDGDLLKKPGVATNYKGVTGSVIAGNTFNGDLIVLQLRDDSLRVKPGTEPPTEPKQSKVRGTAYYDNKVSAAKKELEVADGIELVTTGSPPVYMIPKYEAFGRTHPVGGRKDLAGRENIIITEWGPWDHQSPLARAIHQNGGEVQIEFTAID